MNFEIEAMQQVWLKQSTPEIFVDLPVVRRDARRFVWNIRLRNAIEWAASLAVAFIFAPKALSPDLPLLSRASCGAIVVAAVVISWTLWRDGRTRRLPPIEAPTERYVRAYRDNLLRQANLLERAPRWYLAPLSLGLAGFLAGLLFESPQNWPVLLAVAAFIAGVIGLVAWFNLQAARKLRSRAGAFAGDDASGGDDALEASR